MKATRSLLGLFFLSLFFAACSGGKSSSALTEKDIMDGYVTGVLTDEFASEGCDRLIKVDNMADNPEMEFLNPSNLEDSYKIGTRLKFRFLQSRSPIPEGATCIGGGLWVVLSDVEKIK